MAFKKTKIIVPDLAEFTDGEGKKWIQTSPEDLLSLKELSDVLDTVEKSKKVEDIVLARIDFQNVNKEYYDLALSLQERLEKQTELLKKVLQESKSIIERKNVKLKELIVYIKKLHLYITQLKAEIEAAKASKTSDDEAMAASRPVEPVPVEQEQPKPAELQAETDGSSETAFTDIPVTSAQQERQEPLPASESEPVMMERQPEQEERSEPVGAANEKVILDDTGLEEIDLSDIAVDDEKVASFDAALASIEESKKTLPAAEPAVAIEEKRNVAEDDMHLDPIETPDPAPAVQHDESAEPEPAPASHISAPAPKKQNAPKNWGLTDADLQDFDIDAITIDVEPRREQLPPASPKRDEAPLVMDDEFADAEPVLEEMPLSSAANSQRQSTAAPEPEKQSPAAKTFDGGDFEEIEL